MSVGDEGVRTGSRRSGSETVRHQPERPKAEECRSHYACFRFSLRGFLKAPQVEPPESIFDWILQRDLLHPLMIIPQVPAIGPCLGQGPQISRVAPESTQILLILSMNFFDNSSPCLFRSLQYEPSGRSPEESPQSC